MDNLNIDYFTARDGIQDGDVIFVKRRSGSRNPLHKLTTIITSSPYYHVALAVWMKSAYDNERLMVIEAAAGKRRLVPLSIYQDHDMDVIKSPIDFSKVANSALEKLGVIRYGYFDFVSIGIKECLGLPQKDHYGEVCSEMVAKILIEGGAPLLDPLISPGKLYNTLTNFGYKHKCSVAGVKLKFYNR